MVSRMAEGRGKASRINYNGRKVSRTGVVIYLL